MIFPASHMPVKLATHSTWNSWTCYHQSLTKFQPSRLKTTTIYLCNPYSILYICHNDFKVLTRVISLLQMLKLHHLQFLTADELISWFFECCDFLVALLVHSFCLCATGISDQYFFDKRLKNKGLDYMIKLWLNLMIYLFDLSEIYTRNKPIKTMKTAK